MLIREELVVRETLQGHRRLERPLIEVLVVEQEVVAVRIAEVREVTNPIEAPHQEVAATGLQVVALVQEAAEAIEVQAAALEVLEVTEALVDLQDPQAADPLVVEDLQAEEDSRSLVQSKKF